MCFQCKHIHIYRKIKNWGEYLLTVAIGDWGDDDLNRENR